MKKNIFYPPAANAILERVLKLEPHSRPRWGSLTATEMLLHANRCNEELFQPGGVHKKTTAKQALLRLIALYLAPRFKKGIRGDAQKDTKGKIADGAFEEKKRLFMHLIRQLSLHQLPVSAHHIAFGNLSTRQWGIAVYKHMDHHLRQFGV